MNSIFLIEIFLGIFLLAALIRLFVNKERYTTRRIDPPESRPSDPV